MKPIQGGGWIT